MSKTIQTSWELWTYDVWGNEEDGWQVNDRSCFDRDYPIRLKVQTGNSGTEREFQHAYPSEYQVKKAFGYSGGIVLDGDDTSVTVESPSGYPIGEMFCTSHKSLSPIRAD